MEERADLCPQAGNRGRPTMRVEDRPRPPLGRGKWLLSTALVVFSVAVGAFGQQSRVPREALPTLTTAREAHALTAEEAARASPVHLRAVVTYYNPDLDTLFVHDPSGSVFVETAGPPIPPLHPGALIDLKGVSGPGEFAPIVVQSQIRVLGESHLPAQAPRVGFARLLTGAEDARWVEAEGVVRSASVSDTVSYVEMDVAMTDGTARAILMKEQGADYHSLVDAEVLIHANAVPFFNQKRQVTGVRLCIPSLAQVRIERRAPADPFSSPIRPIKSLLRFAPGTAFVHRVRVRGRVTLQWPGRLLCVQDDTQGLCTPTDQDTSLKVGDLVDVVGFPAPGEYTPILDEAIFRQAGTGPPITAVPVTAAQAIKGKYDAELIRIEGRLVDQDWATKAPTMVLSSGSLVFHAILPGSPKGSGVPAWKTGSELQLTGVCSVEVNPYREPRDFHILLGSPQDVVVLQEPSWWTTARIAWLLIILAGIVLWISFWVVVLRRRVEERTETIRATLESTADGILVVNSAGKIVTYNRKFAEMWRIPESVLASRDDNVALNFVLSQLRDADAFLTRVDQTYADHDAQTDDVIEFKDGRVFERHSEPQLVKGKSVGRVWGFRDFTERKQAEAELVRYAQDLESAKAAQEEHAEELARLVEELARERELLRALMDNLPDCIYFKDRQSRFLRSNRAHAKVFGLSDPGQVVGQTDFDFYTKEQAQQFYNDEQEVITTGRPMIAKEERQTWPDGRLTWFSTTKMPLRDPSGAVVGTFGVSRDITARKRAEEALRESEERYRELFENASDLVFTTDLEARRLTSLNRVAEQTIGYSREEAALTNLRQLIDPRHWHRVEHARGRLLAGDSGVTLELEIMAKDGRRVMLEVKPRLIYKEGKPIGVQGIGRDITGREAAEMELRHAQKLESVGRLASGIAHEINTPIQFVGDNTRFLQDSFGGLQTLLSKYQELRDAAASGLVSPDLLAEVRRVEEESDCAYLLEEIPKALTQTLDGVTRVATIVRAMKDFAHPESKERAAADLNKALLSTLTVARNELKYVADVETDLGDLPLVVCNISDLNQVFLNLLVNAAHAIGEVVKGTGEKGKIRVRTVAEGKTVLVTITDTGCGIPEGIRSKVFDPFFTTKEVGRGTGQGLAIARSVVVEHHKGSLTFESEVGKGTTFCIRLPVESGEYSEETRVP